MQPTRRKFIGTTAGARMALAMGQTRSGLPVPQANGERMALLLGSLYRKIQFSTRSARRTRYSGADQVEGRERYALEYGPLLIAFLDMEESELVVRDASSILDVAAKLRPVSDQPLHFNLGRTEIVPYFQIMEEPSSCLPFIAISG